MKELFRSFVVKTLTAEAAFLLKRKKPIIIALTGSVGKTSTKDTIYSAVKGSVRARKSQKGFNSEIGIPLTVLGLPNGWNNPFKWAKNLVDGFLTAVLSTDYPEVLILETGIDAPGDMDKITSWIKPDYVVLTRLPDVPVHVEHFSSPEAVVTEKMKLVQALKPNGKLVYNNDDMIIQAQLPNVRQEQIGFSRYLKTDFTAEKDKIVYKDDVPIGLEFAVVHNDTSHKIQLEHTIGTQHLYAVCAALAVATELGVPVESAVAGLSSHSSPAGRMRLIAGLKSSVLIDDTYNSSPVACESAIQALSEVKYATRKIAVLGDMLELGKYSAAEHKRIGELVAKTATTLFTVGIRARQIAESALAAGMSEKNIFQYDDAARAGRELQTYLKSGDVVLVKASQGLRAERIVEEVMEHPEQASQLLVRQEKDWKKVA